MRGKNIVVINNFHKPSVIKELMTASLEESKAEIKTYFIHLIYKKVYNTIFSSLDIGLGKEIN